MSEAAAAPPANKGGRHKRKLKNYLLDPRFQLKYTGYLVAVAVLLSVALGVMLWNVSEAVLTQANQGVKLSQQVVTRGQEVVKESKKVSQVVAMNIVKDPDYKDNPALREAFEADAKKQEELLDQQQKDLETQANALKEQTERLEDQRGQISLMLGLGLLLIVVVIGVMGVYVTHKISGPIFKMKRHLNEVAEGHLRVPYALRKGDELVDFFESFSNMVKDLRRRQEEEISMLDSAISQLEGKADEDALKPLYELRKEMRGALDT